MSLEIKSMNKSKVYVVMDPRGKNLLPAKEFGELQIMLTGRESNKDAWGKLMHDLGDMQSEDYLLLIGNPVFIGMATHLAISYFMDRDLGQVNFLVWNPKKYEYRIERTNDECHNNQSADAATSH
jgi:hypothetical protein